MTNIHAKVVDYGGSGGGGEIHRLLVSPTEPRMVAQPIQPDGEYPRHENSEPPHERSEDHCGPALLSQTSGITPDAEDKENVQEHCRREK